MNNELNLSYKIESMYLKSKNLLYIVSYLILISSVLPISASPIREDSARIMAELFFTDKRDAVSKRVIRNSSESMVSCVMKSSSSENEKATYYIFNRQGDPGFVILSGDDSMSALIGYSLDDSIDVENMPEALKLMLDDYDLYVKCLHKNGKASKKSNVGPLEPGTPVVGPYIQTKWSQNAPYNWLTPINGNTNEHMPTGCVPTSVAQILNYYKWPQNSYYRFYNWDDILDSYDGTFSDVEGMAVATLMSDLGCILGTKYKPTVSETGLSISTESRLNLIPYYIFNQTEDIKGNLTKGPLIVSVSWPGEMYSSNHTVIVDGLDSNDLYHINWGWGGQCDGFYDLNNIAFMYGDQEKTASITKITGGEKMIYLLEPDYNNKYKLAIPAAYGGLTIDTETANSGDKITVTLHDLRLVSGNDFDGWMTLFIFKVPKTVVWDDVWLGTPSPFSYILVYKKSVYNNPFYPDDKANIENVVSWKSISSGDSFNLSLFLPNLSNGNYILAPVYKNRLEEHQTYATSSIAWRPLLKFADSTLANSIPFEYQDGKYIFKNFYSNGINLNSFDINHTPIAYYTVDGKHVCTPPRGVYFVKYNDGSVKKRINNK